MSDNSQELPGPISPRPYLIRAWHAWCTDNGFTPHLAVLVDEWVKVPLERVKDGQIVLNVSYDATGGLELGNDFIEFKARFGGVPRSISVPVDHVVAIYARENGQGMPFPPPEPEVVASPVDAATSAAVVTPIRVIDTSPNLVSVESAGEDVPPDEPPSSPPSSPTRPSLKRVK